MVTENEIAKIYRKVSAQLSTLIAIDKRIPPGIHVSAEDYEALYEWEVLDARARREPFEGVKYKGVNIYPPKGYKLPEESGR